MSGTLLRAATRADATAIAGLWQAAESVDDTGEHYSVDDIGEELDNPLIDLAKDWLVAEVDGEVIGSSQLSPRAPAGGAVAVTIEGVVRPSHRGLGLGSAMLSTTVERAREYVAERGALRPLLRGRTPATNTAAASLLEDHGFVARRWNLLMERDLARPVVPVDLPEGLVVSTWEDIDAEELRAAHNVAFADHPGFTPWDADMWRHHVTESRAHRPELSLVARVASGEVAAYVEVAEYAAAEELTGVREAFVPKVGTLPAHRRRGLAAALLGMVLDAARQQGYGRSALDVDSENSTGASRVYERAGFEVSRSFTLYELP